MVAGLVGSKKVGTLCVVAFTVVDLLWVVGKLFVVLVVDGAVGTVVGPCTLT